MTGQLVADRYRLDLHLGRDHDIDQWLGTDTTLDRPVLVRRLDPEAGPERRHWFLAAVRSAAAVSHVHLAAVYAADDDAAGAYAVQEWAGGVTLADRIAAGEFVAPEEVLPNAAGLSEALAALHASGGVHGGIDAAAIQYPPATPAKLDGFGRSLGPVEPAVDVTDLARALRRAVGAEDEGGTAGPGLPAAAARALADAGAGDAARMAAALRSGPGARTARRREWSWTWVAGAVGILLAAGLVAVVGVALRVRPSQSPLLFPAAPAPSAEPSAPPPPPTVPPTSPPTTTATPPQLLSAAAYDPFGTGGERDRDVPLLHDGDEATAWRTERYFDPLERIKQGVGVTFSLEGTPGSVTLVASAGTAFRVAWAPTVPADFAAWQMEAEGRIGTGPTAVGLPPRDGGAWLLWLTELPAQPPDGDYFAYVHEVRFEP